MARIAEQEYTAVDKGEQTGRSLREIDEILFNLQPGDISPVIRTPAGYHLFLVESFRPSRQAKLDELRTRIRRVVREQKAQVRFKKWMAKLKADSYISIK